MSIDEEFVFTFVLPLSAIALSFLASSKGARRILRIGGLYFLTSFSIAWILNEDCSFPPFHFGACETIPQVFANFYTYPHLLNLVLFVFVAPILLLLAAYLEYRTRLDDQLIDG